MKKEEKLMIGILILILIVVLILGIVMSINKNKKNDNIDEGKIAGENASVEEFVKVLDDGTKLNTSDKLKEKKTIDGMEITDLQLTMNGNVSLLLGKITNTSSTTKGGYPINITVLDKKENEIITIKAYIKELDAGESTELNTSATFDYANAYDIKISK